MYIKNSFAEQCLTTVPGVDDFFTPLNSFFISGTATCVYDDGAGVVRVFPTPEHLTKVSQIAEEVTADEASDFEIPVYDERGIESIQNSGLGMYMEDPLTTANLGKIFVD
jgi:hypothetical protein